jgi:hypothetical protein
MARTDSLSNFLIDVASAIKTKKGSETSIPAANFDTEILAIPVKGQYQTKIVNISQNGSTIVTPDAGYDAIEGIEIIVAIPETPLQIKQAEISSNGTISILPDTGYDGFSRLDLRVNVSGGGGDDPAVNAILWNVIGYDQSVFNLLKQVLPLEQQFVAVGGTDAELYTVLNEIYEGGNE